MHNKLTGKSSSKGKLDESGKEANQSEIHKAMADLYSDVDKIANKSFDLASSHKTGSAKPQAVVQKGTFERKSGNNTVSHDIELHKKKEEFSRNNIGMYSELKV